MYSRDIENGDRDEWNDARTNDLDSYSNCPECSGDLVTDRGEVTCAKCGLIVTEYWLDHRGKKPIYENGNMRDRTGLPLTSAIHDRGLSTEIGWGVDGKGNPLPGSKRRRLGRMRTEHRRARWRAKGERNLAQGFREIGRITGALDIPTSVRDQACELFREAQREHLLVGRSIEAMAAGCVYGACRCDGVLRTTKEVLEVATCSRSALTNAYSVLNRELGLEARVQRPRAFVPRFAATCDVPDHVRERAMELVELVEGVGLANGRNPAGVAAACLYVAGREAGLGLTQDELAETAGVTATTLRQRYHELREL